MTNVSARKIDRPQSDWRVTSSPHVGPMNEFVTSLVGTPKPSARALETACVC